jgi:hypothetical protein
VRVTQDEGAEGETEIDQLSAVGRVEARAGTAGGKDRFAAYGAECAHGAIDARRHDGFGAAS